MENQLILKLANATTLEAMEIYLHVAPKVSYIYWSLYRADFSPLLPFLYC